MSEISDNRFLSFLENTYSVADIPVQIRSLLDGDHCVLWKPSKRLIYGKELLSPFSQWRLYPLTSTFENIGGSKHSGLPLDFLSDFTGRTYLKAWGSQFAPLHPGDYINNDFPASDKQCMSHRFMSDLGLKRVVVAFFFVNQDSAPYAITVYRSASHPRDFDEQDVANLALVARSIPFALDRHVSAKLRVILQHVHSALSLRSEAEGTDASKTLQTLCTQLSEGFHCREVTIILANDSGEENVFSVQASTIMDDLKETSFANSKTDGLTGYVLESGEILEFHDLRNFHEPELEPVIKTRYPGINWRDSANIIERSRAAAMDANVEDGSLPPVCFLGVPITDPSTNKKVLGVLRCSEGLNPFFFIDSEKEVLGLIAKTVGHWWADHLRLIQERKKGNLFQGLIKVQDELLNSIRQAINKDRFKKSVLHQAVSTIMNTFKGIQLVCFRRYDPAHHSLTVEHIASKQGIANLIKNGDRFRSSETLAVRALLTRGVNEEDKEWIYFNKTQLQQLSPMESRLYQGLAGLLAVQVATQERIIGILDFGGDQDLADTQYRNELYAVMHGLAKQLSLYEQVREFREVLRKNLDDQIVMTQAVGHQIKTPLANARDVMNSLFRILESPANNRSGFELGERLSVVLPQKLPKLSGMIHKSQSVGRFMEWYGKLSRDEQPKLRVMEWNNVDLARWCYEVHQNNLAVEEADELPYDRRGTFEYFTGEFSGFDPKTRSRSDLPSVASCDRNATEQVLDALISNALKYGRQGNNIEINGKLTIGWFEISVINASSDVTLTESDTIECFVKGYRSERAKAKIGSGLGLWIAKRLMEAQGGTIQAFPTDQYQKTKFTIRFPRS
jgi:signal transduction histidine kinase